MLAASRQKRRGEKHADEQLRKNKLAGNYEVKHHVLAAMQRAAIPGLTKADKTRFDTRCR